MSRSINDSLQLLSETLGNCKTNLAEKKVENVDNIKISDVDEKIAEIKSGGDNTLNFLEYYEVDGQRYDSSISHIKMGIETQNVKFKTKDNFQLGDVLVDTYGKWTFEPELSQNIYGNKRVDPNTEYTAVCEQDGTGSERLQFVSDENFNYKTDYFQLTGVVI